MKILVIGSNGFIAKNLILSLKKIPNIKLFKVKNRKEQNKIFEILPKIDAVFHLAGEIRNSNKKNFFQNNYVLTGKICDFIIKKKLLLKFFYTSTIHTNKKNYYGISKRKAEKKVFSLQKKTKCNVFIYKLPNIFGKGCKPFYNSFVATCCYQLSRNKKIEIHDPKKKLSLLYIDDLVENFVKNLFSNKVIISRFVKISKIYNISVNKIYNLISNFSNNKFFINQYSHRGFLKKLFATYVSYLSSKNLKNNLIGIQDSRGNFCELLKSKNTGQISFLSIKPGKVRGNHYHNSKVEIFYLISGNVRVNMKNMFNNNKFSYNLNSKGKISSIITQPGVSHNIENTGRKEAKLVIWSNEIFKSDKPDTIIDIIKKQKNV